MPSLFSPELEQRDFRMHTSLSPESEDESGKHPLYSTGPKSDFCMNAHFPEPQHDFGMLLAHSPSPERQRDFGMLTSLSLSPEPQPDFSMLTSLSSSPQS